MNQVDTIILSTNDPEYDVPALTTLLHRVCGNNHKKFDEANRLIELFVKKALESKNEPT